MHGSWSVLGVLGIFALAAGAAPAGAAEQQDDERRSPLTVSADDDSLEWAPCPDLFPRGCELAVVQGDPEQANADVLLRVPGGYQIPPHSHTSAERMILVSGEMELHYKGHPKRTLSEGDYAFGPAGLPHVARCVSKEPCTLFIAFERPVDALPYDGSIP